MRLKALTAALALAAAVLPGIALAQDACPHSRKVQMTCADGTQWDEATRRCAPIVGA
jgi:hypothetical protein